MGIRQTRIFASSREPDSDWAETLVGRVIRQLVSEYADRLEWFWFSRYGSPVDDSDDCDIARIPSEYKQPLAAGERAVHRSVRFRYAIDDAGQEAFERRALQLIGEQGYRVSDFRPYDFVGDTGGRRLLGVENRQPGRAQRRAELVTRFYMATCRLMLDALIGPDENGRYRSETNDDLDQNPRGSSFQSLHHLYCNITGVPTDVYVFQKKGSNVIGFGTFIHPPPAPEGGWDDSSAHPIWF